ncbi:MULTISPECIES: type VII secretion protein EssB [unclassified Bacillus (in: firmicutes)]|uniref:type VII secretion protein EssB n=1 Tax=unclassified Bacillus (in: firmicutes) TaxID=185979 RepID=UPI001BE94AF4|nr:MULTISPECIES: type VII secretion protein EssB [unclassified Bacillus (in: firmicutes)]MBT2719713.1 type VII secretion protein EssB [Bacillus sp. ISL-46]MBT2742154.1 type VII secretion protein EssB [Bacillus sp. ISL-77]
MNEISIQWESITYKFLILNNSWQLNLPKSQTRVKDVRQLALINNDSDLFVPAMVEEGDDIFTFSFEVDPRANTWEDVQKLNRKDKLRLLYNLARFKKILTTRMTFFLHPNNLIFDDNLLPSIVFRGIRELIPPHELNEEKLLLQYKCLIVALFSKKYTFDELYSGSLKNAKDTPFERQVRELDDFDALIKFLEEQYIKEKIELEKTMVHVPAKRFRLFKQLTFTMIALAVILAVPLVYLSFVKTPFQEDLLEADRHFLSLDYGDVINDLEDQTPEKLPDTSKYVLAYSFIKTEKLSEDQKEVILKNISIKSDPNYLLYWIYNGRGDFARTIDLAKYIDDPQLIMYGLIKQIEQAKNDPDLSGTEREKKVQKYQEQYNTYADKYGLDSILNQQN